MTENSNKDSLRLQRPFEQDVHNNQSVKTIDKLSRNIWKYCEKQRLWDKLNTSTNSANDSADTLVLEGTISAPLTPCSSGVGDPDTQQGAWM